MLNRFARLMLVATALSPILGAVAIAQIARGNPASSWCWWLIVAGLLILVCWGLLEIIKKSAQNETLKIAEYENNDKEVLAFLLTYLLPFISAEDFAFGKRWMVGLYVMAVILMVVWHANALHFNPVMGLLGYHFHNIKTESGRPILLIGRKHLRGVGVEIDAVELADNIYVQIG